MNGYTMKNSIFNTMIGTSKGRVRLSLTIGFLAACTVLAFAANAYVRSSSELVHQPPVTASAEARVSAKPVQSSGEKQPLPASVVTLWPHGFDPPILSRPEGRFVLVVNNRSGLDEISLALDRVAGNRFRSAQVNKKRLAWGDVIEIPPGDYILKEENHPEWTCQITVSRRN